MWARGPPAAKHGFARPRDGDETSGIPDFAKKPPGFTLSFIWTTHIGAAPMLKNLIAPLIITTGFALALAFALLIVGLTAPL